ncbi:MAG: 6-phosphogluconolactonase [Limisphaerales bacterium]
MSTYELKHFPSDVELASTAAYDFVARLESASRTGKPFFVALSGGRITKQFFNFTVEEIKRRNVSPGFVHFFWADERCVGPDHPDSNFLLANDLLFKPLNIKAENIHRLRGELPAHKAISEANAELEQLAGMHPVLDLVLLGMGEDGHVASLFPNATEATIKEIAPFLSINNSPKPPPDRLSLSFAALAAARDVWILASGKGKEEALRHSLQPKTIATPLARVLQSRQQSRIYTDIAL